MPTRTFTLKIPIVVTGANAAKQAITGVASAATGSAGATNKARAATVQYSQSLGGLQSQLGRTRTSLINIRTVMSGLGIAKFASEILDAGQRMQTIQSALRFATGSAAATRAELSFLKEETKRLGLEFSSSAERYSKLSAALRGTGVDTREVFSAMGEASAVLGLSAVQTERSLFALEQMAGKGVVSMEELRRQLGENLIGAFGIAARAMGKTEAEMNKLVSSGKLLSKDFLPKFAAQLRQEMAGELPNALDKTVQHINRLKTAAFEFFAGLQEQIAPALKDFLKAATEGLTDLDVGGFARGISGGLRTAADAVKFMTDNVVLLSAAVKTLIAFNLGKWAFTAASGLKLAASAAGIFGTAIALGTAGWVALQELGAAKSPLLPLVVGAQQTQKELESLQQQMASLGKDAGPELVADFEQTRQKMLEQIQQLTRDFQAELKSKKLSMSDLGTMSEGGMGVFAPKWAKVAHDEIMRLTNAYNELSVRAGMAADGQKKVDEVTDKVAEKIKTNREEYELLFKTLQRGGDIEFVKFALAQGLTVKEIERATGAKYENVKASYQVKVALEALEERIKSEADALKEATKGMKDFNKEVEKQLDLQNEQKKSIATDDAKRFLELVDIAKFGPGGKDLAAIDEMRETYTRWAKAIESEFGPEGAQRIMKEFKKRQMEALDIKPIGEAWVEVARTMADAFGEAFGKMGDKVSTIINQVIQIIALMKQMGELMRSIEFASGGAGAVSGGGGMGGFGWLKSLFGGGAAAVGAANFTGAYNPAAAAYFMPKGFVGPPVPAGLGGGGFAGFGALAGGAFTGLGIGAGIGAIGQGIFPNSYASIGGTVGGAIGGAIAAAFTGGLGAPLGAAIGGAIGTVVGGLIKKGVNIATAQIVSQNGEIGYTISEAKSKIGKELAELAGDVIEGFVEFANSIGATGAAAGGIGLKKRGGTFSVFGGGDAFRTSDREAALEEATFRAIKFGSFDGVAENIIRAIQSPLTKNLESLKKNVEVATRIEDLGDSGLTKFQGDLRKAISGLTALGEAGEALGLDTTNVANAMKKVWADARDQVIGAEKSAVLERIELFRAFNEEASSARAIKEKELADLLALQEETSVEITEISAETAARLSELGIDIESLGETGGKVSTDLTAQINAARQALELLPDLIDPAELANSLTASFGSSLLSFVDSYYGKIASGEALRAQLEKLNFEIRIAQLRLEFEALKALGVLSQETLDTAQRVFNFIDTHPPNFGGDKRDPVGERERRQKEREARREEAFANLASPMEQSRLQVAKWAEDIKVLQEALKAGVITQERYNQVVGEFTDQVNLNFGTKLVDFTEEYYDGVFKDETMRRQMEKLNFDLRLAQLRMEFDLLKTLGYLSAETVANAQTIFDFIAEHPPVFGGDEAEESAKEVLDVWQQLMKDMATAAESSFLQAKGGILSIFDRIFSLLPEGTMVRGITVTGGGYSGGLGDADQTRGTRAGQLGPGEFRIDSGSGTYQPFQVVLGEMMTVERARFELAKAMQLIELEVAEAQLRAAGMWKDGVPELVEGARDIVLNMQYAAEAAGDIADSIREARAEFVSTFQSALSAALALTEDQGTDQEKQIKETFDRARAAFSLLPSLKDMVEELQKLGLAKGVFFSGSQNQFIGPDGKPYSTNQALSEFKMFMDDKEKDALAKAIGDAVENALQSIRDYFDDLRTSGANLTSRQRFENTMEAFNAAFAAGDIEKAVSMARLLTGEVGIAQFGTATQAFQNLTDFLVGKLGGLLPEGPPEDLLSKQNTLIESGNRTLERILEQSHNDSMAVIRAIDENTRARRLEAGRVN